ncbi:INO80 complex subunit C-like isoform X2 [Panicum virgatum]|uniref:INO80 complex subunit C-like isoform X2 n=1 Tax=Panicum virgatum TaxID=38727 RepID=UPI0019D60A65|nr:INO80 complex subunit C-like isoform X2 [Panicum virgatum]
MELEVVRTEMVLAPSLPFKKVQTADKYPKGQSRGRQWKHLRHLLHAADASSMPPDRPNYLNIQSPPSIYPSKRYCDITGFECRHRIWIRGQSCATQIQRCSSRSGCFLMNTSKGIWP